MKSTIIKRKPKSPLKKLQKRLLDLWSLLVKLKAGSKCEICGRHIGEVVLNSHHIISKSNLTLKWDLRNGCSLCSLEHRLGKQSAHKDPLWFMEWFKSHRPDDYEYLRVKKNERFDKDYIRIENNLKEETQ